MGVKLKSRLASFLGNSLSHYDTALFGLLAPFIAPLFFDHTNPIKALILTYAMMPLGILAKPLGSLFFGWIGDIFGRKQALFYSLCGMALVTFLMGCLPLYNQVGLWAPIFLALCRLSQSFCAAGEIAGSSIFVLENTPLSHRNWVSSLYDVSSLGGALIASGLVTFFCLQGWIEHGWRILFWLGGLTALFGLSLRLKTEESFVFKTESKPWNLFKILRENKKAFLAIILTSGFSYTTYALPFTLMNGYVPLITSLSQTDVMQVNTYLLFIDMLLLPFFGYLAHKIGTEKIMFLGALGSTITAIPLFYLLEGSGILMVTVIRSVIVICGVAFAAPFHAWKLERVPITHRYTILALGYTLGSQLIGSPAPAICLWLYQTFNCTWAPGLYLMLVGVLAGLSIYQKEKITQKVLS